AGEHHWRFETVRLHHVAARQQVEELVLPAELDVSFDRDRIVRLHEGIQQLRYRDRSLLCEPLREVVALEQARDRRRAREPKYFGEVELREPLAVEADLRAAGVDDRRRVLEVALCVRVDLLTGKDRPRRPPTRRVTD